MRSKVGLCIFDFSGSGQSDGDYVTLGWKESDELSQLVQILIRDYRATQIAIWGRSMGAATTIIYSRHNSVFLSSLVLDSPFYSIQEIINQMVTEKVGVGGWLISGAAKLLDGQFQSEFNVSLDDLKVGKLSREIRVPASFILMKEDQLANPEKTRKMFNRYGNKDKQLYECNGKHEDDRDERVIDQCFENIIKEFRRGQFRQRKTMEPSIQYLQRVDSTFMKQQADLFMGNLARA